MHGNRKRARRATRLNLCKNMCDQAGRDERGEDGEERPDSSAEGKSDLAALHRASPCEENKREICPVEEEGD